MLSMVVCVTQRRYAAPPNQAGLKLKSVIGYNGNGRGNMIWHADSGTLSYFFIYELTNSYFAFRSCVVVLSLIFSLPLLPL